VAGWKDEWMDGEILPYIHVKHSKGSKARSSDTKMWNYKYKIYKTKYYEYAFHTQQSNITPNSLYTADNKIKSRF
jgi:hypothetical protein